jgi:competence protein ComEA
MIEPLNIRIFKFAVKCRPLIKPVLFAFAVGLGMGYWAGDYGLLNIGKVAINGTEIKSVQEHSTNAISTPNVGDLNSEPNINCDIKVDVAGAVVSPGVYCLSEGATVDEAIKKAGDVNKDIFAFKYVSQKMNFAKKVVQEQKIYVPFQDDVDCSLNSDKVDLQKIVDDAQATSKSSTDATSTNSERTTSAKDPLNSNINQLCVSLNNASIEELDTLDGVGIATAQKIIEGRPYKTIEDLLNVKGIGQATFDKLKSKICI